MGQSESRGIAATVPAARASVTASMQHRGDAPVQDTVKWIDQTKRLGSAAAMGPGPLRVPQRPSLPGNGTCCRRKSSRLRSTAKAARGHSQSVRPRRLRLGTDGRPRPSGPVVGEIPELSPSALLLRTPIPILRPPRYAAPRINAGPSLAPDESGGACRYTT